MQYHSVTGLGIFVKGRRCVVVAWFSSNQCLYDNFSGFVFSFYGLKADGDVGFASVSKRASVMVS